MGQPRRAAESRARLDERFAELPPVAALAPPVRGWIKAIREALGMSTGQLAKRAGIRQPSVIALEKSEAMATIEIATLKRIAEALDCTLVYALVPNKPLEQTVRERARQFVKRRLDPIEHSMGLENQTVTHRKMDERVEEVLRGSNFRRLWDEP